jgi:RNA polymerase sigma-70 factor, ECF subfamily
LVHNVSIPITAASIEGPLAGAGEPAEDRLAIAAAQNCQFIWRSLRRFGVNPDAAVDDALQQVFEVATRKRDKILPGCERAFLFKTAMLIAADWRRAVVRAPGSLDEIARQDLETAPDPAELLDERQRRALLDAALGAMDVDLRNVFVLFELEELSTPEIARLLEIPVGTAASRLRRARESFRAHVRRLQSSLERARGGR